MGSGRDHSRLGKLLIDRVIPADIFLPLQTLSIKAFVLLDSSLLFWGLQQPETMPHLESEAQPQAESSTDTPQSLPFPPVTYSHILNCSYHDWLPK